MKNLLNTELVKDKLQELGLSQTELSKKIGLSRQAVSKWFTGDQFPRPDKLLKLARILDLGFKDLVIKERDGTEPIIAFRKKARHKIPDGYIEKARNMGTMLETLLPYLPFDNLSQPSSLIDPKDEYDYIQRVVKSVRNDAGISDESVVDFHNLLGLFLSRHAVLVPVLWGDKEHHENALHIYLPSSRTTWIYLNLDCKAPDFKFWMAHELGHVYAPGLISEETSDEAEDFADHFAGALLFPESMALREYKHLCRIRSVQMIIRCICDRAEELGISPVTVYTEANRFAEHHGKRPISLNSPNQIYQVMTNFNKKYGTVGQQLFDNSEPSPSQYINSSREQFKSPIFDAVREYIKEGDKSPGFLQSILSIPLLDAHGIYEALC